MRQRIDLNTPATLEIFDDGSRARVKARVLRTGRFTSGVNGKTFDITMKHLIQTKNNYNGRLKEYVKSLFKDDLPDYELQEVQLAPTCVEHQISDEFVVGRIIGNLFLEDDPITKTTWLCANLEVLGRENVEKVRDGRRKAVSINFNTETCVLDEISFVAEGAIPDACILSANKPEITEIVKYSENKEVNALLNKINKLDESIDNRYLEIAKLRKETAQLDKRIMISNKLQHLVKKCQLTKADMKRIMWTVDKNASEETLQTVNAVLSKLPKCVDTRVHKYNVDDFKLREYLMDKKELTTSEVLAQLNKVALQSSAQFSHKYENNKDQLEASKHGSLDKQVSEEQSHEHSDKHEIKLSKEHLEHLKKMLKDGKNDDAHAYLCSMSEGENLEDTIDDKHEDKKLKHEKEKKHAELKKHEEELDNERKEKAELKAQLDSTNAQLSALTGALNKILNKGE